MSEHRSRVARAIKSFVENPLTNLVKGVALLVIGLTDASHTFRDDITHGQFRVGHGLVIIGLFSINPNRCPTIIEGLEAGSRYLEAREKQGTPERCGWPMRMGNGPSALTGLSTAYQVFDRAPAHG